MSDKAAIPMDVATLDQEQPVAQQEEVAKPVHPRDEVMAEMARKRRLQNAGIKDEDQEKDPASDPDKESVKEAPVAEKEKADDELVMLKVNGREIFKTKREVEDAGGVAAIQKRIAGDLKLEDAARRQKEQDLREQQLAAREQQLTQKEEGAKKSVPSAATTADARKLAEELAEDLVLGDTSKVASALERFMSRQQAPVQQQQPAFDANQLAQNIRNQVRMDRDVEVARAKFGTDFKDVHDNPILRQYANEQTKSLMRENPDWSPAQVLTEAGRRTRAAMGTTAPDPLKEKENRKRTTVDTLPQARTRGPSQEQQTKPKTKAEIFEGIAATRSH